MSSTYQLYMLQTGFVLQRNLTKIEGNVSELEAKLKHEQEKFKTYNKDLKEAEKRYVSRQLEAHLWSSALAYSESMMCKQSMSSLSLT